MADEKKKTGYQSTWQDQLRDTANKIINREKFSYDVNGDALYKQYKDRYTQMGKQAMMDTMGQAATLTGGYGNSYAQNVGQQAYQGYMQQLTDKIPTLYQVALDKYTREGDQLRDNANLMMQQDQIDYGRYRDQLADQDAAYTKLLALMTGYGYQPTAEEMAAAGMTEAQMRAILGLPDPSAVSSGGGGSVYISPRTGDQFNSKLLETQKDLNDMGWNVPVTGIHDAVTDAAFKEYVEIKKAIGAEERKKEEKANSAVPANRTRY